MSFIIPSNTDKLDPDRVHNLNDININLECPIDLLISVKPVMCDKCECLYCNDCVVKLNKCSLCLNENAKFISIENNIINYEINKLLIHCNYKNNGCSLISNIIEIRKHEKTCQYKLIKCTDFNCNKEIPKIHMTEHLIKECLYKKQKCLFCKKELNLEVYEKHILECVKTSELCNKCYYFHEDNRNNELCCYKIEICSKCSLPDFNILIYNNNHKCLNIEKDVKCKDKLIIDYLHNLYKRVLEVYNSSLKKIDDYYIETSNNISELYKLCDLSLSKTIKNLKNEERRKSNYILKIMSEVVSKKECEIKDINNSIIQYNNYKLNYINKLKNYENNKNIKIFEIQNNIRNSEVMYRNNLFFINNIIVSSIYNKDKVNINNISTNEVIKNDETNQDFNDTNNNTPCLKLENKSTTTDYSLSIFSNFINSRKNKCSSCFKDISEANDSNKLFEVCSYCKLKYCLSCIEVCYNHIEDVLCNMCSKKCNICEKILCKNCNINKCYYINCNNVFCDYCYKLNSHQVRKSNVDCGLSACKQCKSKGKCVMSSILCGVCKIRICIDCYKSTHEEHFDLDN